MRQNEVMRALNGVDIERLAQSQALECWAVRELQPVPVRPRRWEFVRWFCRELTPDEWQRARQAYASELIRLACAGEV